MVSVQSEESEGDMTERKVVMIDKQDGAEYIVPFSEAAMKLHYATGRSVADITVDLENFEPLETCFAWYELKKEGEK